MVFVGALLGAYISFIRGESVEGIHMGLFGFNAVLSAIVFSGIKKIDGLWLLIAVFITVFINDILIDNDVFARFGVVLTFPFVAGTCITLLMQKIIHKKLF